MDTSGIYICMTKKLFALLLLYWNQQTIYPNGFVKEFGILGSPKKWSMMCLFALQFGSGHATGAKNLKMVQ